MPNQQEVKHDSAGFHIGGDAQSAGANGRVHWMVLPISGFGSEGG
jgi:hypothetical protein